jgi:hypothetical protein
MLESFFYVAQGKIHLKEPGKPARQIESKFGQSLVDRNSQIQRRNSWKTQGTGAKFMSGSLLWGRQSEEGDEIPVVVNAISRGTEPDEVLYSLSTHEIGGVFSLRGADEKRLLHTADFRVGHLSVHRPENKIACAVRTKGGSHIAVMQGDGREFTDVTQGDSLDLNPNWVPSTAGQVIFQSSGIARNAGGVNVGVSPTRVEQVDIVSGEVTTLLADERFDYLNPAMDTAGNLFCIRKPYISPRQSFNPLRAALDLVLLPFRLLYAVFQFANFFTMRYTGNTLVSSGNMRQREADLRQMMIMDNLYHATRAPGAFLNPQKQWKAPRSWELIRRTGVGEIDVLERSVLTFDLLENGSVLFSDGRRIVLRDSNGAKKELLKDEFISQVLSRSNGE